MQKNEMMRKNQIWPNYITSFTFPASMRKYIGSIYRILVKPVLFLFAPETMHTVFGRIGYFLGSFRITRQMTSFFFGYKDTSLEQSLWWLIFKNPVGVAAGFDKDIQLPNIIDAVWFGWIEVWSITYKPYAGNPWTRLVRLIKSQGLLVNYWLKNDGAEIAKQRLLHTHCAVPLFVSIAKTNCVETCDLQKGIQDYSDTLSVLWAVDKVQGFVLNISCPNAFGGEDYTTPERFRLLLTWIASHRPTKPLLVKLPVDKEWEEIKALVQVCVDFSLDGVIISNLTKQRTQLMEQKEIQDIPWGVSGKPTQQKSDRLIGEVYKAFWNSITIIGVWGIFSANDAYHKIRQGATFVQLITGMIFQWPQLIGEINAWLVKCMQKDGFTHIREAIGANFWK